MLVPKRGDLSDPNKFRSITLIDIGDKIFSSILCGCALKIIKAHGVKYQFGSTPGVGCQYVIFTIKILAHLRHNHTLPSWFVFAYLVKSFDISNHKLLITIPSRYADPPRLFSTIRRMYKNTVVTLIIGKTDTSIPFKVVVKQ